MNECKHNKVVGLQWTSTWSGGNLKATDVSKDYRALKCLECDTVLAESLLPPTTHRMGWEEGEVTWPEPIADANLWWEAKRGAPIDGHNYNISPTENTQ